MRRTLAVALLVATILIPLPAGAHQHESWRWERCRFKHLDGSPAWSTREVARTIECAVGHLPVEGGVSKAKSVAACESGMDADEYGNPPYMGVYQFHPDTWRRSWSAKHRFLERWDVRDAPFNGRSNVLLAIKVVHDGSWSPWSCA